MFFQIDLIVLLKSRSKQQIHFDSVSVKDNLAARSLYSYDLGYKIAFNYFVICNHKSTIKWKNTYWKKSGYWRLLGKFSSWFCLSRATIGLLRTNKILVFNIILKTRLKLKQMSSSSGAWSPFKACFSSSISVNMILLGMYWYRNLLCADSQTNRVSVDPLTQVSTGEYGLSRIKSFSWKFG